MAPITDRSTPSNDKVTTKKNEFPLLRASTSLKHQHELNSILLTAPKSSLQSQIAHRGDHLKELKSAARSTNKLIRDHYKDFIHDVGRNVYPLILFTDYEVDGPSGVGSTLTLYRDDGSITKVSPALNSNYELYKTCGHLLMGLSVEIGPYLANASLCHGGDLSRNSLEENSAAERCPRMDTSNSSSLDSSQWPECPHDSPWKSSLSAFVHKVRVYRHALMRAIEVEEVANDLKQSELASNNVNIDSHSISSSKASDDKGRDSSSSSSLGLPSPEMQETMLAMMNSVIAYCESCLTMGIIDISQWERLNSENFPRIKQCMQASVKDQADACVRQILQWKQMMGPIEWREVYVVIPTVWAVGAENPRKTMMRQLMDADRVDSHIITSEYPRDHGEARTLLGRIVGDRSIGRFVFGDDTKEQKIKVMGLSSEVDVVQDDALPAIWDAMEKNECPVRRNRSSMLKQRVDYSRRMSKH
jgi:hypothetical protein